MESKNQTEIPGSVRVWTGVVSVIQGLLIFVPTLVLGQAINWPASLDDPASVALPRLREQETAVRFGYIAYLILSILFVCTVILIAKLSKGNATRGLFAAIVAFALASTVARSIGIIRWLIPMPQLAESWALASTDQQRYAISVAFDALNAFGGTIGEVLGVSLFASLALFLLCVAARKDRSLPNWLCAFGFVAAIALLMTASDLAGVDPGTVLAILSTTLIQVWFMAVGLWLLATSASPAHTRSPSSSAP